MVAAVERGGPGGPGRLRLRVVPDCSGATYRAFAEGAIDPSAHVLADLWAGIRAGLSAWPGLDQRRSEPGHPEAGLPTAHHVISNFQSWSLGTFHGLSVAYLQSYADEFAWRYSHRGGDAAMALLADCCARHLTRAELHGSAFLPQPPQPGARRRRRRREAPS